MWLKSSFREKVKSLLFFFFNDRPPPEISPLPLPDALPFLFSPPPPLLSVLLDFDLPPYLPQPVASRTTAMAKSARLTTRTTRLAPRWISRRPRWRNARPDPRLFAGFSCFGDNFDVLRNSLRHVRFIGGRSGIRK